MDFFSVIVFLIFYYLRPQEWLSIFASIHFVQLCMYLALWSLFFRDHSIRASDLLKTPHDWAMLAFFLWIVGTSPTPWDTFKNVSSLFIFYIVIVHTLTTVPRIKKFCGWWTFLIVAIAALSVASQHGFDPLNSLDLTNTRMKGRLALNLSIFRNPNALGHNVVPAIPMLYYFCIWRRPIFMKELGLFLMLLPFYCIYLTVSKGSFLAAGVTSVATLTFGRPKWVQTTLFVVVFVFGGTLMYALPRMNELQKAKTDEAIQGRVAAFTHGLRMISERTHGVGHGQWLKSFFETNHFRKAAHSSYVQVGAELGYPGFFIFFLILYCCLRTLITAKTTTDEEERIRRILFILVVSYMISSWMVDLGYRPTFFMFAAAIAAFHRHLHGVKRDDSLEVESTPVAPIPTWRARLLPHPAAEGALADAGVTAAVMTLEPQPSPISKRLYDQSAELSHGWNRINLVDLGLAAAMTFAAVRFWAFILKRM